MNFEENAKLEKRKYSKLNLQKKKKEKDNKKKWNELDKDAKWNPGGKKSNFPSS